MVYNADGISIKVMKKTIDSIYHGSIKYITEIDQVVTPFSIKDNKKCDSILKLTEVLGPLKLNKFEYDINDAKNIEKDVKSLISIAKKTETETTISRGYCLNIPQIGFLIISHNADVIVRVYENNVQKHQNTSLYIETPGQVILNTTNASYLDLNVVASSAVLAGKCNARLGTLTYCPFSNDNIINCLFVDKTSLLALSKLIMKNSFLLNMGELNITELCDIKGGSIFNMGKFNIFKYQNSDDQFKISYFFNGSLGFFKAHKISIQADYFSNLGSFEVKKCSIQTKNAFDNQGKIIPISYIDINGESEVLNKGYIEYNNGKVNIYNKSFLHNLGMINLKELNVFSNATFIKAPINAEKVTFHNSTINSEKKDKSLDLYLQELVVYGSFLNKGNIKIQQTLRLEGPETVIYNHGLISTGEVVCNSDDGFIQGTKIIVNSFKVNGKLQSNIDCEDIEYIEVNDEGELFIGNENKNESLKRIKNKGIMVIKAEIPNLVEIENDKNAHIQIDTKCKIKKFKGFEKIKGISDFSNVEFYNIPLLELPSDAIMNLFEGAKIYDVEKIIVHKNSSLTIREGTMLFNKLTNIYNFGEISNFNPMYKLLAIYNGPNAKLNLFAETVVYGRLISNQDSKLINMSEYATILNDLLGKTNKSPQEKADIESKIGVFNEGSIYVKFLSDTVIPQNSINNEMGSFFQCVPANDDKTDIKNMKRKGLLIYSTYVSSKSAYLILDDFTMICSKVDFINLGTIYSSMKLMIKQDTDITCLGTVGSQDGIDVIIGRIPFYLNGSFKAVILGDNKQLNINSANIIEISNENTLNADLNIQSQKIHINGNLTVNSLYVKTNEFHIEKSPNEKYVISSHRNFEIYTNWFMNNGGILQTQEKEPCKLFVSNLFQNTGGGEFNQDHSQIAWYSTISNHLFKPHFEQSGLIATGGKLDIIVGSFDNCFGIINGLSGINIESSKIVNNECGLIYSGGKTTIKGSEMNNGFLQVKNEFDKFNLYCMTSSLMPDYFIVRPKNGYYNSNMQKPILAVLNYNGTSFKAKGSKFPGYIFSVDDLHI